MQLYTFHFLVEAVDRLCVLGDVSFEAIAECVGLPELLVALVGHHDFGDFRLYFPGDSEVVVMQLLLSLR